MNKDEFILISEKELLGLMRSAFISGNKSYLDVCESVVEGLFADWTKTTETLELNADTKKAVLNAAGPKKISAGLKNESAIKEWLPEYQGSFDFGDLPKKKKIVR